jgi:hypothetical protein
VRELKRVGLRETRKERGEAGRTRGWIPLDCVPHHPVGSAVAEINNEQKR